MVGNATQCSVAKPSLVCSADRARGLHHFRFRSARGGPVARVGRARGVLLVDARRRCVQLSGIRPDGPLTDGAAPDATPAPMGLARAPVFSVLLPLGLIFGALYGFYWTSLQLAIRLHVSAVSSSSCVIAFNSTPAGPWCPSAAPPSKTTSFRTARPADADDAGQPPDDRHRRSHRHSRTARRSGPTSCPQTRILHQVELWSVTQKVTVSEIDPSGVEHFSTEERLVAITLAELFRSVSHRLADRGFHACRSGLARSHPLSRARATAYATPIRPSRSMPWSLAGLALAFDAIGIGWSSIQWLVAAIGVGLGFGLQEIFANFISGLIILFERPIRVGDVVSVGDVSGTVSRIRTRATWITAFDRKELLVPNKEFVTGQLINWTLSDAVLRLSIPVGIAYGSDTNRAIEVLEQVAKESWRVFGRSPSSGPLHRLWRQLPFLRAPRLRAQRQSSCSPRDTICTWASTKRSAKPASKSRSHKATCTCAPMPVEMKPPRAAATEPRRPALIAGCS